MFKTYCRNIARSFYDASLYKEAIEQPDGIGGKHILFLSAIVGLVLTALLGAAFYAFNKYELPNLVAQIPQIDIKDNVLTVKGPDPVMITTREKDFRVLIDTKTPEVELHKKEAEVVVGKTLLLIKQPNGFKPIVFEGIKRYTLTKEVVADFFHKIYAFLIVAFPLMSLGQAFNMLAQVFLVALLSYAVTAPMPEEYYFPVRMRIAAYAITPPFVVSKLTSLFTDNPLQAPLTSVWFSLMLALLYFYVMIVLIRRIDDAPAKA